MKTVGFGYSADDSGHYFMVTVNATGPVVLHQHINGESRHVATFTRNQWDVVAQPVRADFNRTLGNEGYRLGRWLRGETPIRATMGKELLLLSRAIEDCSIERIPIVLDNWRGLHPTERWWLCTQSQACHEGPHDKRKGWRIAIKYALGAMDEEE